MINYFKGDIFNSDADALAHGCNTVGKMGAGIAKQFKERFPDMYDDYKQRCKNGLFLPGEGYIFKNPEKPHVINLATQKDSSAKMEYLRSSIDWLSESYEGLEKIAMPKLEKIAMPKIGSGLGRLEWDAVEFYIKDKFEDSALEIEIWSI